MQIHVGVRAPTKRGILPLSGLRHPCLSKGSEHIKATLNSRHVQFLVAVQ
jgi:hypothetical protein